MQYSATFANYERMFCFKRAMKANSTLENIDATLVSYDLYFQYYTPKLLSNIPKTVVYPHQEIEFYPSNTVEGTAGTEFTLNFNSLNLSGVPRKMILWISERHSDIVGIGASKLNLENLRKTDTAKAKINSVSITYGNRQSTLANAKPEDLYEIAKKRGLNMTYKQFVKYIGSYCAFEFGEDIPLSESEAPGLNSNPQLSMTVKGIDVDGVDRHWQLNTVLFFDGVVTIVNGGSCIKQRNVLNANDIIDTLQRDYEMVYPSAYHQNRFGGSPLAVLSSILPIAKGIRGAIQTGAPIAKMIADGAEKIGLGVAVNEKGKKKKAGRISGGEVISRSQLSSNGY